MRALAEALRPLRRRLAEEIDVPVLPIVAAPGMDDEVPYRLRALQGTLQHLADACNSLMTDAAAVARLAQGVDELLAGRRQLRSLNVPWPHTQARDLLAGVYRHHLLEVRDWLGELLEASDDPETALRRRGLPTHGRVDLPITLTFTPALQLHRLANWLERRAAGRSAAGAVEPKPAWWRKVGAFGLGWAVGNALFGNDCGCDGDA